MSAGAHLLATKTTLSLQTASQSLRAPTGTLMAARARMERSAGKNIAQDVASIAGCSAARAARFEMKLTKIVCEACEGRGRAPVADVYEAVPCPSCGGRGSVLVMEPDETIAEEAM